ncbi:MAG: response regulator transcription factor [Actinomycetota bacterium]|nr:response regulator transcription factor [Actinomycetota bacterium]
MSRSRTTVLVADDHPLYRAAVARAVGARADLELVGVAEDGEEALAIIRDRRPAVAVLDVQMPALDGVGVLEAIGRDGLGTRVVLLSADLAGETVYAAVAGGVGAYLSKASTGERICEVVAAVARGEVVLPAEVQAGLAAQIQARDGPAAPVLTAREGEVLALIADGLSAPAIGARLHLSTATIKTHLHTLYEKLGVSDRAAAVAEAMRRGMLD